MKKTRKSKATEGEDEVKDKKDDEEIRQTCLSATFNASVINSW